MNEERLLDKALKELQLQIDFKEEISDKVVGFLRVDADNSDPESFNEDAVGLVESLKQLYQDYQNKFDQLQSDVTVSSDD